MLEGQQHQPPTQVNHPPGAATAAPAAVHGLGRIEAANSLKFEERSEFNFGLLILWLLAAFCVAATVFFWWIEKNNETTLQAKLRDRTAITSELTLPVNIQIEQEAADFKDSVSQLSNAYSQRVKMSDFLTEFSKKIDKDVKLENISVSTDGAVNLTGSTASYRAVAEQIMALKESTLLSKVDLTSAAVSDAATGGKVTFSITATLNKTQATASGTTTPSPLSMLDSQTGGAE